MWLVAAVSIGVPFSLWLLPAAQRDLAWLPITVPSWLMAAVLAGLVVSPVSYVLTRLLSAPHQARVRQAMLRALDRLCNDCGYDLTGNASGVCPECGRRREDDAKTTA